MLLSNDPAGSVKSNWNEWLAELHSACLLHNFQNVQDTCKTHRHKAGSWRIPQLWCISNLHWLYYTPERFRTRFKDWQRCWYLASMCWLVNSIYCRLRSATYNASFFKTIRWLSYILECQWDLANTGNRIGLYQRDTSCRELEIAFWQPGLPRLLRPCAKGKLICLG